MRSLWLLIVAAVLFLALSLIVFIGQIVRFIFSGRSLSELFYACAVGIDHCGAGLIYLDASWSISAYTWKLALEQNRYAVWFAHGIDFLFGLDHCQHAYMAEIRSR